MKSEIHDQTGSFLLANPNLLLTTEGQKSSLKISVAPKKPKPSPTNQKTTKMQLHHLLSLLLLLLLIISSSSSSSSLSSDIEALLSFKNYSDPLNNLRSWTDLSTNPCSSSSSSWLGLACSFQSPPRITRLVLENLSLTGPTLYILTNLTQLRVLSLKSNNLSGPIPDFSHLSSLRLLFLSHNKLSGALPPFPLSNLTHLYRLDLSYNHLSGPIHLLGNNSRLLTLRLDSNNFTGTISGLAFPNLLDFNVSFNSLSGAVPPSLSHFLPTSFLHNDKLCGSPLPSCRNVVSSESAPESPVPPASAVVTATPGAKPEEVLSPPVTDRRNGMSKTAVVAIVVGDFAVLLIVAGLLFCYFWRKFSKRNSSSIQETEKILYSSTAANATASANVYSGSVGFERGKMVFFEGTKRFELEDLLRASAEMLGKGGYGTAYKAVIEDGNVVAVKRLRETVNGNGVTRREFENQMEVVGRLRQANLVGLKAYYYARDEKLLVYEYMAGGSLFSLLHGNRGPGRTPLDWNTRIRIAAGAARGLAYIHHANSTSKSKLAHGNIKATNILIDKSLTPKLSDFALSPLFPPNPPRPHGGYAAPELLLDPRRPVSQKADIYAFGVVLLEILTGKVVTEDVNLPQWVQSVVREEWTSEVFDLELMRYKGVEEEMVGLLQVAMACVAVAPQQRPKIGQVVKMIEEIRGDGSPAYESFGEIESPCVSDETGTIGSM